MNTRQEIIEYIVGLVDNALAIPIFALIAPEAATHCVVYTPIGGVRDTYYKDAQSLANLTMQFDVYSPTSYADVLTVSQTIQTLLDNKSFSTNLINIQRSILTNINDSVDESTNPRTLRDMLEFAISY